MDHVIVGIVLALIGLAVQPPVNGIAFSGGPHFSHYGAERTLGMTATVAATTSWGLELDVAYARRGYDDTNCVRGTRIPPADSGLDMDIGGVPPCFGDVQHFHRRVDYIDAKLLWRHEFLAADRVTPNLLFGGLAGFAGNCRNEPLDSHPVGDCLTDGDDVGVPRGMGRVEIEGLVGRGRFNRIRS